MKGATLITTNNPVIPKLTIDVTLGSTRVKHNQPPTTLNNDTIRQPNLIILNTPPSPATTPTGGDKGILELRVLAMVEPVHTREALSKL